MNDHDLKTRLQSHFSDGLTVVVGSGLSCAEGLPGMGKLAEHLRIHVGPALEKEDLKQWSKLEPLILDKGLEAALLEVSPRPGVESQIARLTGQLIAEQERSVVSEVFNGTRILRLTKLVPHLLRPAAGLPVITTNYDRLVEVAIEEAGLGVDTMFIGRYAGKLNPLQSQLSFCRDVTVKGGKAHLSYQSRAIICKPHGSLDWYLRGDTPVHYAGDLTGATRLIITPGHNKFRNGYDSPFDRHRERANQFIDKASRFLIIGYGFNDDHLETHLAPAIKAGKPTLMLTHGLSEKAKKLAHLFANVIAIESMRDGTRMIIDKMEISLPNRTWWDLESFVRDILEP